MAKSTGQPPAPPPAPGFTEEQVAARIEAALADAEGRWATEAGALETRREAQIAAALEGFGRERVLYFRKAETEVVHLALAVSRKILQREASLDPDLLAALVRIALDRMGAGPAVRLRVPPADLAAWERRNGLAETRYECDLVADGSLGAGDCVVETDLGTASLGFEAQLKEVEQGMLDLLALRPELSPERAAGRLSEAEVGQVLKSGEAA
jgi:flagellar assembly protein FliH